MIAAIGSDAYKQAIAYGMATGLCSHCNTALTRPESLKLGMGPRCGRKAFPDEWVEVVTAEEWSASND